MQSGNGGGLEGSNQRPARLIGNGGYREARMPSSGHPADQHTVRRHNLTIVLDRIVHEGRLSRARISTETGLNPSTVSSLAAELIARGLVREAGVEQSGAIGRPGRSLELDPNGGIALGLEISDDGLTIHVVDLTGASRYRRFVAQDNHGRSADEVIGQLAVIAKETLQRFTGERRIPVVATLAVPGIVGTNHVLLEAPNLNWHEVPVKEIWRSVVGPFPLLLDNEARLAAYAEMTQGAASNLRTFAYVSGGTGLGAGIVIDRQIYRGAHGFAGEFGHITIEPAGPPSIWGARGTLESLAGERALAEMMRLHSKGLAQSRNDPDWANRTISALARSGDDATLSSLEKVGRTIGIGLATMSNLFDLEAIVLGGFLSHIGEWLHTPITQELVGRVLAHRWSRANVLFSNLGREASVRGAARWSLRLIYRELGEFAEGQSFEMDVLSAV